jgi:hypothetical protein
MTKPDRRDRHRNRTHRQRSGNRCPNCGRPYGDTDRVDVHHRDGNAANGSPDNLRKRCKRCHLGDEHDRDTSPKKPTGPRSGPGGVRTGPR